MKLHTQACEYYRLDITTEPAVLAGNWQLSLDRGDTWIGATVVDGLSAWLLAGPDYEGGENAIPITKGLIRPLLRLIDNPETIVRGAPSISLLKNDMT